MATSVNLYIRFVLFMLELTGTHCVFPVSDAAFSRARGPLFVTITGPNEVTAGVLRDFTCTADCSPPCTFTWSLGVQTVQGHTIEFTANGGSNSAELKCTALNPESNVSSTTTKIVKVTNPVSIQPNKSREPTLNQSFSMTCAGSVLLTTVIWYKNGQLLPFDEARMSLSGKNSTLSFSSLLPSDGGFYQCEVSNSSIEITSIGYLLSYGSLNISISGPDTVEVGMEHVFTCLANCTLDCSIHWSFRGGFPSGNLSLKRNVVRWTPIYPNTVQEFTCVAENLEAQRSATASKNVTVSAHKTTYPPKSKSETLKTDTVLAVTLCAGLMFILGS